MPRIVELVETNVDIVYGEDLNASSGEIERTWTIVYQDQRSGDLIRFTFHESVRDYLVERLMGGIVLARNSDGPKG